MSTEYATESDCLAACLTQCVQEGDHYECKQNNASILIAAMSVGGILFIILVVIVVQSIHGCWWRKNIYRNPDLYRPLQETAPGTLSVAPSPQVEYVQLRRQPD